jgi:hypothetical protein
MKRRNVVLRNTPLRPGIKPTTPPRVPLDSLVTPP